MYEVDAEVDTFSWLQADVNQYLQTYDVLDAHTYGLGFPPLNFLLKAFCLRCSTHPKVVL